MNIIKLQDELKGVPDQTLVGYVQSPTGQVPTYLALGELQRRKTMREKYQKQQAPQSTVAEDMAQEAAPQPQGIASVAPQQPQMPPQQPAPQGMAHGGVATLDTGNMYDEKNFATGGIVAFEDGGEVKHYATGDYVTPSFSSEEYWSQLQDEIANAEKNKGFFSNPIKSLRLEKTLRTAATPYDEAIKYYQGIGQDNAVSELQMQKYKWLRSKTDPTQTMQETGMRDKGIGSNVKGPITMDDLDKKIAGNTPTPPANDTTPSADKNVATKDDTPVTTDEVGVTGNLYDFERRPEDQAKTEMDKYASLYGDDPFTKKGEARLKDMDARAEKDSKTAPWMALAQAGFGMMSGTSPHALTNIGQGAALGLKSYEAAQERADKSEERRFNIESKVAEAQRAVKLAAINHGVKSEEFAKASNDLKDVEVLKGKFDIKKYETLAGTKETQAVYKQKENYEKERSKYLENHWEVQNALRAYDNKDLWNKKTEQEKQLALGMIDAYKKKLIQLNAAYPLATMTPPAKDPMALLRSIS